ncbi:hypothetical protein COY52_08335 [Candidatus Desantisbacteria bacterium CG_4_10_14_0_8_um_filter_48_22]|uniref:4Fe-4S ferredoxin-type domain-containing protein n=1 Tax=Candidatus Desantisbacteria bacterium CG_4_10_14_0_8_um_filter_48_22 TaxID=1974543 RepID=A0A2M7S962_9BACT|nr:MAG: hypothetical protein AUJ67_08375 [Candidatus Desantisbacteria bacterium CG1_02_49_89]PIV56992.1 MAG: hypothetical protein COS16_02270 [Candidatus Desantisbacteria bacterium CG02_land_8_20_14_3_00_49_13]PIZ15988.1 MAG: hypothetical protein COY52_08335 [Candidatus Desantisbacteria bacterium CG_4_10_14_0_8_um_filter_48_22]PJB28671.1 MAG: hypothetical protein CO111_00970 [Candidatus Desantisbacteria bacterium CG_4_9_14_3_um_filter_50_7]
MSKRLYIDLEICNKCPECVVKCSYLYHPGNNGITRLREEGAFNAICRLCDNAPCVTSCPNDALKRDEKRFITRSGFKCTGCHSCVAACPFGTIFTETIPFTNSQCDLCIKILKEGGEPACVPTCPYGALKFGEFAESAEEFKVFVGERMLVRALPWKKPLPVKKK